MKKALLASFATSALLIGAFAMSALSANAYSFSGYLSVGSTGTEVTALQSWLVSEGYLTMPAGVSMGYFGSLTKAAVVAYQAAVGLPATGYVGPLTVAKLNAGGSMAMTGTTGTCPAGYSCTSTPAPTFSCPSGWTCTPLAGTTGTTVTGSTATGITTPGVQGIISVTQGPISNSVANAGQTKVPILDVRIQAQYSDLAVQSLQLDLGTSTNIYNFVYSNMYVVDPSTGNVLGTIALNPSTVVQNGNNYVVSVTGFNFIVPKGTYKDLVIEADLYNQINNNYTSGCVSSCQTTGGSGAWTIGVDGNGVRAIDGAGINQYGPTGGTFALSQTMIVGQSLITQATANVSLDSSSPLTGAVGVTNTTQGTYSQLPVMTFDVNAQGDNLHLHQIAVNIGVTGAGASVNAAYLYNGSTQVSSASISNGVATFANITDGTNGASIPVNTSVPFTVKVDVAGLTGTNGPAVINASTSALTIYNSQDSNVSINGSAMANTQTVFGEGPVFSLSGAPTMTGTNVTPGGSTATTTYSYQASFNVNVQAVGESVSFGLPSIYTAAFGTSSTATGIAQVYVNSVPTTVSGMIANFAAPSNTTVSSNGNYFTLGINQSVTIPVSYTFSVTSPTANSNQYAVQINGINWFAPGVSTTTSSFMAGQTSWRTCSVSLGTCN